LLAAEEGEAACCALFLLDGLVERVSVCCPRVKIGGAGLTLLSRSCSAVSDEAMMCVCLRV
jgi:hypothetical protein